MLKQLILRYGGAMLILAGVAVVMSFFVTVTHEDAVYYLDRQSAIQLLNPRPAALYAVDEQRIFGNYLCEYQIEDGDIFVEEVPRYYEFYNQAGRLLPFLAALNTTLVGGGENGAFYRQWQVRDLTFIGSSRPIKKNCEKNVTQAIDSGKKVCRLDAVMIRHNDGAAYAVKFNNFCLVKCAEDSTSCHPAEFPPLDDVAWTTRLKHQLDLITGGPAGDPEPRQVASK